MAEILKGATLVELSPARVEKADLRVEEGRITARGGDLPPMPGDRVTDLTGRYVMPGLVVSHTHLYSALARGMPPPAQQPRGFVEILEKIWWKLDRALDEPTVELCGTVGAAEALFAGVTTVIDHHASPNFIEGSLFTLRKGIDAVGLRSVLCYEVTDRNGKEGRDAGLRESEAFLRSGQTSRCRALVGGHASFTLDPDTLERMVQLAREFGVGIHIHVAESPDDERDSRKRFESNVLTRLAGAGVLGPHTILAHGTHLSWEELSAAQQSGSWLIHNPRSNMNNAVGYAPAGKFGARKALGTDGIGADMLAEMQAGFFRGCEAGYPIDALRWLSGGHSLATELFGTPIGQLEAGAVADLMILDYPTPTPISAENLGGHLLFGLSSANVDSVMVDGIWRLWARQVLALDYRETLARSHEAARILWSRMREM